MEFNLSTFILEIINFLILIWILQRLFYKPLLEVIAKRKQHIDQSLADAKKLHQEAEELRSLYENRQKLWLQEKKAALNALHQQIEAEKRAQMDKLRIELDKERQKAKVTLTRQQQEIQQLAEQQALQNGARFAGMLLKQSASPELEARLFEMLLDELKSLPEVCTSSLQMAEPAKAVPVKIFSAFPLAAGQRLQLEQKLGSLITCQIHTHYQQDVELIAGLRIDIGAWVLNTNLQHELIGFAEMANEPA